MDAEYGEVETSGNIAGKSFYDFRLLDAVAGADNDTFRYGEITVPVGFVYTYNDGKGFHVRIPYTPDMRRLTVRLVMESGSGGTEYLRNPATGKHWFPSWRRRKPALAGIACLHFSPSMRRESTTCCHGTVTLPCTAAQETDFEIGAAKAQNETFLLKASAGNLYQHSTTGVGLVDYLHSSLENNGLAAKLQSEFLSDKVVIKNAYMDSATGELLLETEEKEENDG